MTKFVSDSVGPSPGLVYPLVTLAGIGTALYIGAAEKNAFWRIAGWLLVTVCIAANFVESSYVDNAWQLASRAKTEQELQTATRSLEKNLAQADDPWLRFQIGVLAAYQHDDEKHAQMCHQGLSKSWQQ